MRAEIISIGDELTSGQRLDTNSQWLSQRLGEIGVPVVAHATVADDRQANVEVFRQAIARADVVISTGGLGPTADDLTREVLAEVGGVELALDPAQLEHIKALFARRHRPMPERNVVQAMFPSGSQPIFNPQGTAPGIYFSLPRPNGGQCHLFALPGVPAEMFEMWEQSVRPKLIELGAGRQLLVHRRIKCFGVGESDLEQMLPDLIRRGREPQVGITVSDATITLRITAAGSTIDECRQRIAPTEQTIHDCLGNLVVGYEDDELHDVVVRLLRERQAKVVTCEWTTAGLLARRLAQADGGEGTYLGGMVSGASKASAFGVSNELAARLAAVIQTAQNSVVAGESAEHALEAEMRQLATFCCRQTGADYALAVSPPCPGPGGQALDHAVLALATPQVSRARRVSIAAHSAIVTSRLAKQGMNWLRLTLLGRSSHGWEPLIK